MEQNEEIKYNSDTDDKFPWKTVLTILAVVALVIIVSCLP